MEPTSSTIMMTYAPIVAALAVALISTVQHAEARQGKYWMVLVCQIWVSKEN